MALKIFNTLSKQKEDFKSLRKNKIGFYQCGPTVYWTQHLGNMRAVVLADFIVRSLQHLGYQVTFVRNYTDVGHLTSDEDEGEDKIEKGARKENLSPEEIAQKYITIYDSDIKKLNTLSPFFSPRATKHIKEIVEMIELLLDKGFAYQSDLAIYFDISKVSDYNKLSGQKIEEQILGAGAGEVSDSDKKNPQDFALWFFKKGVHKNALQVWNSPWGIGFPGWHIECSAMSKKYLGETIDIHMGGIEHIPVHHTNEIAQSESSSGKTFVNFWIHNGHLFVNDEKMSKSKGTSFTLADIEERGFNPLDLRFFFLQAHYRSRQNFTWEALENSRNSLKSLKEQVFGLGKIVGEINSDFVKKFREKIEDDFNFPQALAVVSEIFKSNISQADKLATILDFDKILGLKLSLVLQTPPLNVVQLVKKREVARREKDFQLADNIRDHLFSLGYEIKDTDSGPAIFNFNY